MLIQKKEKKSHNKIHALTIEFYIGRCNNCSVACSYLKSNFVTK